MILNCRVVCCTYLLGHIPDSMACFYRQPCAWVSCSQVKVWIGKAGIGDHGIHTSARELPVVPLLTSTEELLFSASFYLELPGFVIFANRSVVAKHISSGCHSRPSTFSGLTSHLGVLIWKWDGLCFYGVVLKELY